MFAFLFGAWLKVGKFQKKVVTDLLDNPVHEHSGWPKCEESNQKPDHAEQPMGMIHQRGSHK